MFFKFHHVKEEENAPDIPGDVPLVINEEGLLLGKELNEGQCPKEDLDRVDIFINSMGGGGWLPIAKLCIYN